MANTRADESGETTLPGGRKLHLTLSDKVPVKAIDAALRAAAFAISRHLPDTSIRSRKIIGKSEPMLSLFDTLRRLERTSGASVVITGENGTGKELVARSIHECSPRSSAAFVATNCSAFNDNLLESELFGHKRGAFTGAINDKPGLFEVADKGTFFLDEVGDMSPALQVKLLRVLQEGTFTPVGATSPKRVDVRIIAATNRDLQQMVRDGTFREDLYYRLHVVVLRVPPLRERKGDIPLLVDHFLSKLASRDGQEKVLTEEAMEALQNHPWPGNVRELENEIERLWVLSADQREVGVDLLSRAVRDSVVVTPSVSQAALAPIEGSTLPEAVEFLERKMIEDALVQARGNKTKAADILGISRRTLIRKVKLYDLEEAGKK